MLFYINQQLNIYQFSFVLNAFLLAIIPFFTGPVSKINNLKTSQPYDNVFCLHQINTEYYYLVSMPWEVKDPTKGVNV